MRDREGSRGIVRDRNGGIVRDSRIFGTDDKPLARNFGNFRIEVMNEFFELYKTFCNVLFKIQH